MISMFGKKVEKIRSAFISYRQNASQANPSWQQSLTPGFTPDVACIRWYSTVATETGASAVVYGITSNLDVNGDPLITFRINSSGIVDHWFTVNPAAINTGMTSFQLIQSAIGPPGVGFIQPAINLINFSLFLQIEFYKFEK